MGLESRLRGILLCASFSLTVADIGVGQLYRIFQSQCPLIASESADMIAEEECVLWCKESPECHLVSPVSHGNGFKCYQHDVVHHWMVASAYDACNICKFFLAIDTYVMHL